MRQWYDNNFFQETSIDSVADDVAPIAFEEEEELPVEEEPQPEPEMSQPISPEKSPRDGAVPTGPTETVSTTKIRFDDFLNLMEVF